MTRRESIDFTYRAVNPYMRISCSTLDNRVASFDFAVSRIYAGPKD